jgi:hypothetical protein
MRRSTLYAVIAILLPLAAAGCRTEEISIPEPADRLSSALVEATRANRLDEARRLLERGARPDSLDERNNSGDTALILAARGGYVDIVRALIDAGADVNLKQHHRHEGRSPLIIAAYEGHAQVVAELLRSGAHANARMGLDGTLPGALYWAVSQNHQEVVNLLLSEGATVGRQEILQAIRAGEARFVRQLLAAGGDPYWRFSTGRSVLEEAEGAPETTRREVVTVVRQAMGLAQRPDRQ